MICHNHSALPLTPSPLPVAMILEDFAILLIPPVSLQPLTLPCLPPASFTTVGMSAITGLTDQEHRAATGGAAKQLSKWNFCDNRSRAGVDNGKLSWQAELTCREVWLFLVRAAITGNPDRSNDRGFSLSASLYLNRASAPLRR